MKNASFVGILLLVLFSGQAWCGGIEVKDFPSKEIEERYKGLTQELRCTVCQNQSIAESNAELAQDLRRKTFKMLLDGKSDQEIKDYMADRYGNFVLYTPPVSGGSLLLWVLPFVFLAFGVKIVSTLIKQNRPKPNEGPSDSERLAEIERLLADEDKKRDNS